MGLRAQILRPREQLPGDAADPPGAPSSLPGVRCPPDTGLSCTSPPLGVVPPPGAAAQGSATPAGLSLGGANRHATPLETSCRGAAGGPHGGRLCWRPGRPRHSAHPRGWPWAPWLGPPRARPLAQAVGAMPQAAGHSRSMNSASLMGCPSLRPGSPTAVPGPGGAWDPGPPVSGGGPRGHSQRWTPEQPTSHEAGHTRGTPGPPSPHPCRAGGGTPLQGVARGMGGRPGGAGLGLGHWEPPLDHRGSAPQAGRG